MADRVSVSPITDDMRRKAFAVARETWDRMRLASVTGDDVEYEKCSVDLIVGKVLDIVAGVSAGCAATTGAPSNGITDDMVERAATVLLRDYQSEYNGGQLVEFASLARDALSAALAGCTVVALPEPDGTSIEGDPLWSAHVDYEETIFACVDGAGHPVVEGPFSEGPMAAVTAEMFGLRLLAAAREARRLAGGSQEDSDD